MRTTLLLLCCAALMSGCAGGPPHDYYNPAVANPPKFKGDVTIELVDGDHSLRKSEQQAAAIVATWLGERA